MSASITLALSLLFAPIGEPSKEAKPKTYALETAGTTAELKAGAKGVLKLKIKPEKGYHVSPEAPLKIVLSGDGLSPAKATLGHDDADDKKSEAPAFQVGFGATSAGKRSIAAEATFFVCNESLCERQNEKLTVWVDVKP
jgi:hypothetical protein